MDVVFEVFWVIEVFGKYLDVVNFWMGDERVIILMYKDYYENLYCVILGEKVFILLLLSDFLLIFYKFYILVRFKIMEMGNFEIVDEIE